MEKDYLNAIIENLSIEYEITPATIKKYLSMLRKSPLFDEEDAAECLTLLCDDRMHVAELIKDQIEYNRKHHVVRALHSKKLSESVSDVIKTVYGDLVGMDELSPEPRIYDETDYDVMEREDKIMDEMIEYFEHRLDIDDKAKEKAKEMKKKKDVQ